MAGRHRAKRRHAGSLVSGTCLFDAPTVRFGDRRETRRAFAQPPLLLSVVVAAVLATGLVTATATVQPALPRLASESAVVTADPSQQMSGWGGPVEPVTAALTARRRVLEPKATPPGEGEHTRFNDGGGR